MDKSNFWVNTNRSLSTSFRFGFLRTGIEYPPLLWPWFCNSSCLITESSEVNVLLNQILWIIWYYCIILKWKNNITLIYRASFQLFSFFVQDPFAYRKQLATIQCNALRDPFRLNYEILYHRLHQSQRLKSNLESLFS